MREQKKRNRLLDALEGKGAPIPEESYTEVSLKEMAQTLKTVPEEVWGKYAFAREPLEGRFTEMQKEDYIKKANACGREWADKMIARYQTRNPNQLAVCMGQQVRKTTTPTGGGVVLFAQYVQPNEITIFTDCMTRASKMSEECDLSLLQKEKLTDILLAHELFHVVEEQHAQEIYTRTEKVELWKKPFSNRSAIVCLSEIAAMSFAKTLLELTVSPYMLDVLLVYPYNKNVAFGLYEEICGFIEEEKKQC